MSISQRLENILDQAKGKEKEYDWAEAAKLYGQALRAVGETDFLRRGEIQERTGCCFHRAAFQAESQEQFRQRMQRAIEAYKKASRFYEKLMEKQKSARILRCKAVSKYLGYWLISDPSEKRRLLDECLKLEDKALTGFSELGNMLEYGRTYNELSDVFWIRILLEWDREVYSRIVRRGVRLGEKSVAALSELGVSYEIARTYLALAICLSFFFNALVADLEKKEQYRLRVIEQLCEAGKLSESVGDAYLVGLVHLWLGFNTVGEESVKHFGKALECSNETRDTFLKAFGLDFLAFATYWKATATEDPDRRNELAEEAMKFYDEAQQHFSIMSFQSTRPGLIAAPGGHAEHYLHLAEWETNPEKRLEFLEKSVKVGTKAVKVADDSDSPTIIVWAVHILSKTLEARARVELNLDEKRSLLNKALKNRERSTEILERWNPFSCWNLGVMYNYLSEIKAELSYLEPDEETKRGLLEQAISNKQKCLELINKIAPYLESQGDVGAFAVLYKYQDSFDTLLNRLHKLTHDPKYLRKAIEISQEAVESAKKANMIGPMAGSYWKIAKIHGIVGEHLKAAENFKRASESYIKAAHKIPQLRDFYQDHASYMEAWNQIEKAKLHHAEKRYGQAKEHYERAANLHKSTERWNYLTHNYLALALVEEAEDLSRREQTEEARDLFQQATGLFVESEKSIKARQAKVGIKDEKEVAAELAKASGVRERYCRGRIALEEAKILDRQGDHAASSSKYGSAAEKFQKATDAMKSEADRQELKPIVYLCRAWRMMTRAEAEASPDMYSKASKLFDEAKEHSLDEKAKILALGHSCFCKALEAGAKFETTRDATFYSTAKRHIEAATNYYLRAGFKNASEYAKATYRLFDAYMYTYKAQTETDPEKKAQFYQMAEKLLQASVGSYIKAKHPEKSEEVRRLLESVKEERQLATSLTEVLHAPTITSTTTSFSTPTPTHEQAVGLERFEHADIQANLILRVTEVKVDEDVSLAIELVNAGKAPALLIKVDEAVPKGFEIKQVPEIYTVEDSYINMKGRRLNPLKTVDVKMVVNPRSKGTFIVKPRVLYIDETGKYKSHEPEPVTITVKELGIKGWIKGER